MTQPVRNGTLLKFPEQFLWGTSTSTTQIEGHIDNEWTDFVARDGQTCRIACDSYHRYAEDIEWMQRIGVNAYRMGIEWSRLQSDARASLHQKELARYIDQLDRLNAAGIAPMIVLHHFSNPPWVNAIGGWTNPAVIPAFIDFVTKLVKALRGHVRLWNTFNEPDTYGCCGYLIGEFPPLRKGRLDLFRDVVRNMAEAHDQACIIIREADSALGPVEVGFSKNWTYFQPYSKMSPWDIVIAGFLPPIFQSVCAGKLSRCPRKEQRRPISVSIITAESASATSSRWCQRLVFRLRNFRAWASNATTCWNAIPAA